MEVRAWEVLRLDPTMAGSDGGFEEGPRDRDRPWVSVWNTRGVSATTAEWGRDVDGAAGLVAAEGPVGLAQALSVAGMEETAGLGAKECEFW